MDKLNTEIRMMIGTLVVENLNLKTQLDAALAEIDALKHAAQVARPDHQ